MGRGDPKDVVVERVEGEVLAQRLPQLRLLIHASRYKPCEGVPSSREG